MNINPRDSWNSAELRIFKRLSTPPKIQHYLDALPYNIDPIARSPRQVLRHKRAHCFDGALFVAAALEVQGYPPLLMDLRATDEDDDHVLAIYQEQGHYGAIAKSNYTGCRYRDPVYRTLRELAMSYFNIYFNLAGKKTLREYSSLFDLRNISDFDWRFTSEDVDTLGFRLDRIRHYRLISRKQERLLIAADDRLFRAETLGLDPRGAHKVKNSRL